MNENYVEPIIINTDTIKPPVEGNNLYISRKNMYESYENKEDPKVSICVVAYNRVEKTRKCVESIIKYTTNVNYELFLIDNGSDKEMLGYFKSVNYDKKVIIKATKNVAGGKAVIEKFYELAKGKYLVQISNDVYVTKNWLNNILRCFETDDRIGAITPMSSNVSNLQEIDLNFNSFEEMHEKAAKFNISNPLKWEERMRLVTPMLAMKREVLDLVGRADCGFFHDFGEDDWTLRIRRAGYKLILCGDTFVHHDHDFRNLEDKDPIVFQKSLEIGAKNYKEKYHGLDAWEDILNFERNVIEMISDSGDRYKIPNVLGIDVRCGTPILEIKNKLRRQQIVEIRSSAFTTQAKYYQDLLTVTDEVKCDRMEYLGDHFLAESFDYIILGEPINMYNEPIRLIQRILSLLKRNGTFLFKFRNTSDIYTFLNIINNGNKLTGDMPMHISIDDLYNCINIINPTKIDIKMENYNVSSDTINEISNILNRTQVVKNTQESLARLFVKDYLISIIK